MATPPSAKKASYTEYNFKDDGDMTDLRDGILWLLHHGPEADRTLLSMFFQYRVEDPELRAKLVALAFLHHSNDEVHDMAGRIFAGTNIEPPKNFICLVIEAAMTSKRWADYITIFADTQAVNVVRSPANLTAKAEYDKANTTPKKKRSIPDDTHLVNDPSTGKRYLVNNEHLVPLEGDSQVPPATDPVPPAGSTTARDSTVAAATRNQTMATQVKTAVGMLLAHYDNHKTAQRQKVDAANPGLSDETANHKAHVNMILHQVRACRQTHKDNIVKAYAVEIAHRGNFTKDQTEQITAEVDRLLRIQRRHTSPTAI